MVNSLSNLKMLIARMIGDYVKDGKVKDTYWTERKN